MAANRALIEAVKELRAYQTGDQAGGNNIYNAL